jgi:hypothetical protein
MRRTGGTIPILDWLLMVAGTVLLAAAACGLAAIHLRFPALI